MKYAVGYPNIKQNKVEKKDILTVFIRTLE